MGRTLKNLKPASLQSIVACGTQLRFSDNMQWDYICGICNGQIWSVFFCTPPVFSSDAHLVHILPPMPRYNGEYLLSKSKGEPGISNIVIQYDNHLTTTFHELYKKLLIIKYQNNNTTFKKNLKWFSILTAKDETRKCVSPQSSKKIIYFGVCFLRYIIHNFLDLPNFIQKDELFIQNSSRI